MCWLFLLIGASVTLRLLGFELTVFSLLVQVCVVGFGPLVLLVYLLVMFCLIRPIVLSGFTLEL